MCDEGDTRAAVADPRRFPQHLAQDTGHRRHAERGIDCPTASFGEPETLKGIGLQLLESICESLSVPFGHHASAARLLDHPWDLAGVRTDDGHPARERLHQDAPELLRPSRGGPRGQGEHVHRRVRPAHVQVVHPGQ
jgi:hypothetical protein